MSFPHSRGVVGVALCFACAPSPSPAHVYENCAGVSATAPISRNSAAAYKSTIIKQARSPMLTYSSARHLFYTRSRRSTDDAHPILGSPAVTAEVASFGAAITNSAPWCHSWDSALVRMDANFALVPPTSGPATHVVPK